jgi:UDP-N-acetylmuramoylalanine--D-glutamate ligase
MYHILKKAGKRVHLGGNVRGVATLALLPKIKAGDYLVLELSSWQLQGFAEQKISPHVAVFTNFMPDHMNYYDNSLSAYFKDKSYIFKYQKKGDTLVTTHAIARRVPKTYAGTLVVTHGGDVPRLWKLPLVGEHNTENTALALAACRSLKVSLAAIRAGVESFKAVEGRLQKVRTVRGVAIYNDNNATTPEATLAALRAFPEERVVLIMGGADKGLPMDALMKFAKKHTRAIVFLPGTGTEKLGAVGVPTLAAAVDAAMALAEKGDAVLFSPAFASFGMFTNEYDRNDQFVALVKKLV